jgi:tyrosyl-tRNA synthetase
VLVDNAEWLRPMPLVQFLRDVGKHFTVNAMIAKESVRARLEDREQGISYTEFSYMLLQAYDFQQLHDRFDCRLQIGGSDQWGNITAGIDLIRRTRQREAFGLTTPLVTRADGRKYGKSEGADTPWLAPDRMSPYRFYQYWMNLPDAEVPQALRMFTFLPREEIEALEAETAAHPERRAAQRVLAWELTALVHGEECARQARHASEMLFSPEVAQLDEATLLDVFSEAPSTDLPRAGVDGAGHEVAEILVATGLSSSRSAARRDLAGGGISLNNRRLDAEPASLTGADLMHGKYALLRKGRKNWHLVRFC